MLPPFAELAEDPDARLDHLCLAVARELRGDRVDAAAALATLDRLGAELADVAARTARTAVEQAGACAAVLGGVHGFAGDPEHYDDPRGSMLDLVLLRKTGLPILLSVVYIEVARRAGLPIAGVGLPGHYVCGHFGTDPPLLLDPFGGGAPVDVVPEAAPHVRPWTHHETTMRVLNNLVGSYQRRGQVVAALRVGELRLLLPAPDGLREELEVELQRLRAPLN